MPAGGAVQGVRKGLLPSCSPGISPMFVTCFKEIEMKKIALIVIVFALSACNTIHGVGKDIEKGGQAIEKAAK